MHRVRRGMALNAFGPVLYRSRVACSWLDVMGASLAAMGLSHAIARGIWQGLVRKDGVFQSTMKGATGNRRPSTFAVVREEAARSIQCHEQCRRRGQLAIVARGKLGG